MESQSIEPPDIAYLIRSIPNTEITSTLQLLQEKTSPDLHDKILNINNSISSVNNAISHMSDYDLMYLYGTISSLSDVFQNLEDKVLTKLKNIRNEYVCNVCMKRVRIFSRMTLLGNLNSHICSPSMRLDSGDKSTSPVFQLQEYNLCQTVHYDYSIKQQLFFEITNGSERVHFYTIYQFEEVFICLVCECNIFGRNNVLQHVYGQKHVRALNQQYEILNIFHSNFAKLESKYQLLQREFGLVDNLKTECMKCTKNIPFKGLLNHLKGSKCFKNVSDSGNTELKLVNYDDLIKKTIYKDLLEKHIIIGNWLYPILQNIENRVYCLACNTSLTENISVHIKSRPHFDSLSAKNVIDSIKRYHTVWVAQPVSVQIEQVYFRRREGKITCTFCSMGLPYDAKILLAHVESANHKKFMMRYKNNDNLSESGTSRSTSVEAHVHRNKNSSESVSSRSTSVEAERHISPVSLKSSDTANKTVVQTATNYDKTSSEHNSPAHNNILAKVKMVPYDKSIFDELYPDGLMHFTTSIGCIKYPVIIKRGICKHCFACSIDVASSVLLHANSFEHQESLNSESRRSLLKKFHDLWLDMPSTDQCRQVLFNVDDKLFCILCKEGVDYDTKELKSHLDSWGHVQKVMSMYYNNVSMDKKDETNSRENIGTDSLLIDLTPNDNQRPFSEENLKDNKMIIALEKLYKEDVACAQRMIKQDLFDYFERKTTTENCNKAILETQEMKIEHTPTKLGTITYSKEILNELYAEELIHYHVRINNVKYPCIQNMGSYKRCLICNIDLIGSVLFHINSMPHIDSSKDSKKIDQLKGYHDLWLSFSESDQREQKYFEIGEKLTCAPCQKELDYDIDTLNSHIFSIGHGNKVWSLNNPSAKASDLPENDDIIIEEIEISEDQNLVDLSGNQNQQEMTLDVDNSSPPVLVFQNELPNKSVIRNYDQTVLDIVYLNLMDYTVKVNNQPFFYLQNRNGDIYCLICRKAIANVAEHVIGASHLQKSVDVNILNIVKYYHGAFIQLPPPLQLEQIYFKAKYGKLLCLICCLWCSNDIEVHLISDLHTKLLKKYVMKKVRRSGNEKDKENNLINFDSATEDDKVTEHKILNLDQNLLIDSNQEVTTESTQKPKKKRPRYTKKSKTVNSVNSLKNETLNEEEIKLLSWTRNYLFSEETNCVKYYIYSNIPSENTENESGTSNSTTGAKSIIKASAKTGNIHNLRSQDVRLTPKNELETFNDKSLCLDWIDSDYYLSQETNSVKYYLYSTILADELTKSCNQRSGSNVNSQKNMKANNSTPTYTAMLSDDSALQTMYDTSVMNTIYSGLLQYVIRYNNKEYVCLQNRNEKMFCLLCRVYIADIAHADTTNHIDYENHLERLQLVQVYHNIFSSLAPHYQSQQIYFSNNYGNMTCSICGDTVSYVLEDVAAHMDSKKHKEMMSVCVSNDFTCEADVRVNSEDVISDGDNLSEEDCDHHINATTSLPILLIRNNVYYCVVCQKRCNDGIDNHMYSSKHIVKIKKRNSHVDQYFLQLRKIYLPYKDLPNDLIPSTISLTFCLKCGIHVEYRYLTYHLERFHQDIEYDLKDKLSEDFPFIQGPYSKGVLQTTFRHSPPECDIIWNDRSHPVLQVSGQSIYCLVCKTKVIEENRLDHLASDDHISLCSEITIIRQVKKYHSGWSNVGPKYWNHLQFFDNEDNLFHCIVCNDKFGKKKMKNHLENGKHLSSLIEPNYLECGSSERLMSNDRNSESLKKILPGNELLDTMYPKKINEIVRKMNCLDLDIIQRSPNKKFTCLVCQVEMDDVIKHTTKDLVHQAKLLDSTTNIEPIRFYHQSWSCIDADFKALQNLFYPVTPTIVFCMVCCLNLNYSYLLFHLRQCHVDNEVALQQKLNPVFIFVSMKEYCEKVRKILYKDNVPQCDIILESVGYPVIQTLHNTMRCLLCYKEILEDKYDHLSSREHIMNARSAPLKKRLKSYHETWLDGDEDFQLQQMYFERDALSFYCKICLLDANTWDLREHIRTDLHKASLNKFLINERVSGKSNVFQDIEIMPHLTNDKIKMDSLAHTEENYSLDSESEDNETCPKRYDETVLEELYPHFNTHCLILDNVQYPLFRRTVVGLKCMICKRNPEVFGIDQHLTKDSHNNKVIDGMAQKQLKKFHDTWMKQEASVQMHQKYFHRMKCIPCDVQIEYEMVGSHVLTSEHNKNIALPFLRSESEEGSDSPLKSVPVPSAIVYDSNTYVPFKNVNSNNSGSPIKEVIKNKAKSESPSKAGTSKKSQHDIRKSVLKPNSSKILDKIPLRYAVHKKFLIMDKSDNIFCECCSKKLKHDIPSIKEHLDSAHHLSTSHLNRKKIKYYCELCLKHYSMESSWDNHLVDLTHMARFNNLGKNRKENMTEYECLTCKIVIFGDEISLKRHIGGLTRKKAKEITLPKHVVDLLANRVFIVEKARQLLLEANEAYQSQDKEKQVCTALVKVLKEIFPMCKAYPFGSRVTGLGYCDSDLDVFLDIGDMYHGNQKQDAADQTNIVNRVAKLLQKHKNSFGDINKVAAARTPIVQVFHKESNIDCDISFRHGLSVENTAFISLCLDLQPILRPTMLYLKEWYAATNLSGLSSYALTILMVFYLQTEQFLLSIKELRSINPQASNVIDGWETIKYSVSLQKMKEAVKKCDYTVIELMENFFDYYAKFDFEKWVICPLLGDLVVTKGHFNGNGTNLPPEMSRYVVKLYCLNPEYFRNLTSMCVQDPFDLSHNLTKACGKDMVRKFQAYCDLSRKHISALN